MKRFLRITETIGRHQTRVAHQVYIAPDLKKVKFKGHAQLGSWKNI